MHEFLNWFKDETERFWIAHEPEFLPGLYPSSGYTFSDWYQGTKWQPYTRTQIAAIEKRWGIKFPWDYRLFLQLVGTPDRPALKSGFRDSDMIEVFEADGWMNWRADDLSVAERLNWPMTGLIEDTERPWWWTDEWGGWQPHEWPLHPGEAATKILMVARAAPTLIPFYSHRYLLPQPPQESLGLSVMGSDIIVYAYDLCVALSSDFADLLSFVPPQNLSPHQEQDFSLIPFWGRFI